MAQEYQGFRAALVMELFLKYVSICIQIRLHLHDCIVFHSKKSFFAVRTVLHFTTFIVQFHYQKNEEKPPPHKIWEFVCVS